MLHGCYWAFVLTTYAIAGINLKQKLLSAVVLSAVRHAQDMPNLHVHAQQRRTVIGTFSYAWVSSLDECSCWQLLFCMKQGRQRVKGRLMMKEVKHLKDVVVPRNET